MASNPPFRLARRSLVASVLAGSSLGVRPVLRQARPAGPLRAPATGTIPVAFLIDEEAAVIDFAGPWEVFEDATFADVSGFSLFTVGVSKDPVKVSGGMKIIPDYSIDDAPDARVIIIPAQSGAPGRLDQKVEWLKTQHLSADVIMSVCTGAYLLAKTGLLNGLEATTHHGAINSFSSWFPKVKWRADRRFVENGQTMTTAGLSAGIDGALRVLERYFGRAAAHRTVEYLEYEGRSWLM